MNFIAKTSLLGKLGISCAASTAVFVLNSWKTDFDRYFKKYDTWSNFLQSKEVPGFTSKNPEISDSLKRIVDEVYNEVCKVDENIRKRTTFDTHFRLHKMNIGISKFGLKSLILLPDYFNIETHSQLKAAKLNELLYKEYKYTIKDNSLWMTPDGLALIDSFVLSPKAKKYLIATTVNYSIDNLSTMLNFSSMVYPIFAVLWASSLLVSRRMRGNRNLTNQEILKQTFPVVVTMMILSFVPSFRATCEFGVNAKSVFNGLKPSVIRNAENPESIINRDYYDGAMEYYTKLKQRHKALRNLINMTESKWSWKRRKFSEDGERKDFSVIKIKDRIKALEDLRRGMLREEEHKVEFV